MISVFIPPFAWYRAAEGFFWCDDFDNHTQGINPNLHLNPRTNAKGKHSPKLLVAMDRYQEAIGVFPSEFLAFTVEEQEIYIRGMMDAQYALAKQFNDPNLEGYVGCLNKTLSGIISSATQFTKKEGMSNWLMPWNLAVLTGKTCPPEFRERNKEQEYKEAATGKVIYNLWEQLDRKISDKVQDEEAYSQKNIEKIDIAFIRGVLDGQVYFMYGKRIPGLIDLLSCYNRPKILKKIFIGYRSDQLLNPHTGANIDSVFWSVRLACEPIKNLKDE